MSLGTALRLLTRGPLTHGAASPLGQTLRFLGASRNVLTQPLSTFSPSSPTNRWIESGHRSFCSATEGVRQLLTAQTTASLPMSDFLGKCASEGLTVASSDLKALEASGMAFYSDQRLFLRPELVGRGVSKALAAQAVAREEAPHPNLVELQLAAEKRSQRVSWGVMGLLATHFSIFFWGTYIEYSWDVTEPLAFFSQLAVQIAAFLYFLRTRVDFSPTVLKQRAFERHLRRLGVGIAAARRVGR